MYKLVQGDLFSALSAEVAIGHGCNCRGFMGAGIAKPFGEKWPVMYEKYRQFCQLGQFHPGMVWPYKNPDGQWIYNLATQNYPGANAELEAIYLSVSKAMEHAQSKGLKALALPKLGAGIGGLKWQDVEEVLSQVAEQNPEVDLIVYSLD